MKRTPVFEAQLRLGAQMTAYAGWEIPERFSAVQKEAAAVRAQAGLFDLSYLGRFEVSGPEAARRLEKVVAVSVSAVFPGKCQYGLMCNEAGGILDEMVILRTEEETFLLLVTAAQTAADLRWIRHFVSGAGVTVSERTAQEFLFGVQGPAAARILQRLCSQDLSKLKPMRWVAASLSDYPALIARSGNCGEDGFEIHGNAADAEKVWDILLEAGKPDGLTCCGLAARDLCRLEAGRPAMGVDIDASTSPLEAGLGWAIHHDNELAMGRGALIAERIRLGQGGRARHRVGFIVDGKEPPPAHAAIWHKSRQVGEATSGNYSYVIGQAIGMGYVEANIAPGAKIEIETPAKMLGARVAKMPFIRKG